MPFAASVPVSSYSPFCPSTGDLPTPFPHPPFCSKASSALRLVSTPIGSAEKGHPFSRRPELEFEVERASYFMINTFLTTTITPLPRCPKSSKCPLLPPTLSWQLAEGRTFFFPLLQLLKNSVQLLLHPFPPPYPKPANLLSPVSSEGHMQVVSHGQLPQSQKPRTQPWVSLI